uniref:Branchpoint-bridging protein n=1 Tax=Ciona savignyi TaxID=51511 RepID=H2ZCW7_CIOSA
RSPSPEPIYNGEGKRMNTREYRTRKKLEEERHRLIIHMQDINPEFKPPMDYKPPQARVSERVMIPQDMNPNINFVGLLIGPRGNTLKKIEKDSNCKIMIRGKGSVKEGKIGRKDGQPLPGEDEPLHALVSSSTIECVKKAVTEINKIIKQGIEQPEEDNDLRKLQLMELAKLNGTLREDLMPKERAWLKPENQNITNTTVCTKCGGRGHLVQDCRADHPSNQLQQMDAGGNVDRAKMDSEYQSLMAELGEGPPSGDGNNGGSARGGSESIPESARSVDGPPASPSMMNQGGPPPWMQSGPYGGQGAPNQWAPPGGMNQSYGGGDVPPWMQQPDGSGSMMGPPMGFSADGSNSGGNYFNQPPPPPPGNAPQPPPPPSSGANSNAPPWQQWGGDQGDHGGAPPMPSGPGPVPPPPPGGQ